MSASTRAPTIAPPVLTAGRRRPPRTTTATAPVVVVLATAAAQSGQPTAMLPWPGGTTILGRLFEQLTSLGAVEIHVITRRHWERSIAAALDGAPVPFVVQPSDDVAGDLRAIATIARAGDQPLIVADADIVAHREALARLLADPRIATGILSTTGLAGWPFAFRTRSRRGRVIAAGSPHHSVHRATGSFLGVLKIAPADRATVARQNERLADLVADPSPEFAAELDEHVRRWHRSLARTTLGAEVPALSTNAPADAALPEPSGVDPEALDAVALPDALQAHLELRRAAAPRDAAALTLVGLVRAGAPVGASYLRTLFWTRPFSPTDVDAAVRNIAAIDEDKVVLDSSVKATDGFFTTFLVSPYSKYLARWAARAGMTPNLVTTASLLVGVLAAVAFSAGDRAGLIVGAVLLQAAFTLDCVDGQMARYSRQFTSLGAWLDSVFDRAKEYAVFAGLAIGAASAGDHVWLLAGAALALQTVRHMADFSYAAAQHQRIDAAMPPPLHEVGDGLGPAAAPTVSSAAPRPGAGARVTRAWRALDARGGVLWAKRILLFPIGERFAVISITAALWSPRVVFIVLIAWGGLALAYSTAGRLLRSLR